MEDKITYPIEVDKELWNKFKTKVSRDKTMNDVIVELIKKFVGEKNV